MNNKAKILLVEDEATLSMIIKDTLEGEGFELILASDGLKGFQQYSETNPDAIIADIMLPNMDGFEMVKNIRKSNKAIPILFLTARSSLDDLVHGFEIGANDYIKKPFKMLELIVRIKALLNKNTGLNQKSSIFYIGNYTFNPITQVLYHPINSVNLSHIENGILELLCININGIVEIETILNNLWNNNNYYNRNSLHVFIYKLRRLLSADNHLKIINIRGIGYKLIVTE